MKTPLKILHFIVKIILPVFLLSTLAGIMLFFYYLNKIPNIKKINEEGYELVSKLYTSDGKLMKEYAKTSRYYTPLSELPPHVINAFLAAEDAHFFENIGIDIRGIIRAGILNIKAKITGNTNYQGASTITQQLIKNILLTNEKTLERKIKEILLSVIVTRELSKEKILELYLNYIFLGYNAYGIESAAMEYFGKHAKDLTISEAATLAAMPKAPSVINPRSNYQRALNRRNWVIDQMTANNFIDIEAATIAKETPITHIERSKFHEERHGYNAIADHISLVETQRLQLEDLYTGGFFIKSTIDSHLQNVLFQSVKQRLDEYQTKYGRLKNTMVFSQDGWCEEMMKLSQKYRSSGRKYGVALEYKGVYNVTVGFYNGTECEQFTSIALEHIPYKNGIVLLEHQSPEDIQNLRIPQSVEEFFRKKPLLVKPIIQPNAGAVVMHIKTGKVLAMVGDYFDTPNGFNRATQAYRQLGSTIKPFVYQVALENGFSPASKFIDAPLTLGVNWTPENHTHDYLGPVTLRRSLELSRNIPTVRLADVLGMETIRQSFIRFGFIQKNDEFNLSSVLGSTNITPLKATESYAVFPSGGKYINANFIEFIQDRHGKVVYQNPASICYNCDNIKKIPKILYKQDAKQLTSPQVAYQITSMLESTVQRGTASAVRGIAGSYVGAKTGTTNDSKDAWFIGFNDQVVVTVYVGFDDATTLGSHEYGATLALPIFGDVMAEVVKKYPSKPFEKPFGITEVLINSRTGEQVNQSTEPYAIVEYFKTGDEIPQHSNSNTQLYGY